MIVLANNAVQANRWIRFDGESFVITDYAMNELKIQATAVSVSTD